MRNHKSLLTALGAALLGLVITAASQAGAPPKDMNYLTFSGPVGLPGVTLAAGTYIFERADQNSMDIVRVSSKDRRQVYLTAFTHLTPRPAGLPANRAVTLGEAPAGTPAPITAWFPIGEQSGHAFIYGA